MHKIIVESFNNIVWLWVFLPCVIIGGIYLTIKKLCAVILMGGVKRVGSVTQWLIPMMSAMYIICCLAVIICNAEKLPKVLSDIVFTAFTPKAAAGGASGILLKETISWVMRRSAFSNEAGLGSAAIAHASADNR